MSSEFPTTTTTENGYEYYTIPEGYPLYKASRNSKEARNFEPGRFYFFGVKNESPEYIESFEEEYGIIFEFKTGRSYKLLAMDNPTTRSALYDLAPPYIKTILDDNYGRKNGIRYTIGKKDSEFSKYICSIGFDGYAIHTMTTHTGGRFHSEFMICDTTSMKTVKRVTTETNADKIIADKKHKEYVPKKNRRQTTRTLPSKSNNKSPEVKQNLFGSSPIQNNTDESSTVFTPNKSPNKVNKNLFDKSPVSNSKSSPNINRFDSTVFTPNKSPHEVNKNLFGNSIPNSSSRKTKRIRTPTPRTP